MPSRLLAIALSLATLSATAGAQVADTPERAAGSTITGTVHDSLSGRPLAGATVQIIPAADPGGFAASATSDSLGRFSVAGVPRGRYAIGFLHPVLDSLGLSAPILELLVDSDHATSVSLAIPSAPRIAAAICGVGPDDEGGVVLGTVRDAWTRTSVAGASVTGEWVEVSISREGIRRRMPRLVATSSATGWFALCGVPRGGTMALVARLGADSTDMIEVEVPTEGILRRDLYIAPRALTTAGVDTAAEPRDDSVTDTTGLAAARPRREGGISLRGTVSTLEGGKPLPGALVSVPGVTETRTNAQGEWVLGDAPGGTRVVEVRALGFYPERRVVDVVPGAGHVQVSLSTLRAILDTVKVTASRNRLEGTGFDQRRRSGMGRYITAEEIARRQPYLTSDLLRMMPGVQLMRTSAGGTAITVRGGTTGRCSPAIYLDGHHMRDLSADDLDMWADPENVAGIEVYSGAFTPAEFQAPFSGCGSIVVWTRPPVHQPRYAGRQRVILGVLGLGFGIGALLSRL